MDKIRQILRLMRRKEEAADINITLPRGISVTLDAQQPALFINESGVW